MKYEEPNMEILFLERECITSTSSGLEYGSDGVITEPFPLEL